MTFPSAVEEAADVAKADAMYETAISRLRGLTRDKKTFPLVFEENKNYGYERNMLGMRKPALIVGCLVWVVLATAIVLSLVGRVSVPVKDPLIGVVATTTLLLFWLVVPGPDRVRRLADIYAARLFEACWMLDSASNRQKQGKRGK